MKGNPGSKSDGLVHVKYKPIDSDPVQDDLLTTVSGQLARGLYRLDVDSSSSLSYGDKLFTTTNNTEGSPTYVQQSSVRLFGVAPDTTGGCGLKLYRCLVNNYFHYVSADGCSDISNSTIENPATDYGYACQSNISGTALLRRFKIKVGPNWVYYVTQNASEAAALPGQGWTEFPFTVNGRVLNAPEGVFVAAP
jgi:hypothetical protein